MQAFQRRRVAAAAAAAAGSSGGSIEAAGGSGGSRAEVGCGDSGDRGGDVAVGFGGECIVGCHGDGGHCSRSLAWLLSVPPRRGECLYTRCPTCLHGEQRS